MLYVFDNLNMYVILNSIKELLFWIRVLNLFSIYLSFTGTTPSWFMSLLFSPRYLVLSCLNHPINQLACLEKTLLIPMPRYFFCSLDNEKLDFCSGHFKRCLVFFPPWANGRNALPHQKLNESCSPGNKFLSNIISCSFF